MQFYLLILLPLWLSISKVELIETAKTDIWKPDFNVFTVYTHLNLLERGEQLKLHELYSTSLERAVIKSQKLNGQKEESEGRSSYESSLFYVDAKTGISLFQDQGSAECTRTQVDGINSQLKLDALNVDLGMPKYIVGPAKWLFYLRLNKSTLTRQPLPESKNLFKAAYQLKLQTRSGDWLVIDVFYASQQLPVHLEFKSGTKLVATMKFFAPRAQVVDLEREHETLASVALGPFTLDPRSKCIPLIYDANILPQLKFPNEEMSNQYIHCSFTAKYSIGSTSYETFVGYDSSLQAMRIERDDSSSIMKEVINFRSGRRYSLLNKKQDTSGGLGSSRVRCVASPIEHNLSVDWKRILLGFSKAEYLGQATVRNSAADVYISVGESTPFWFEELIEYHSGERGREETYEPADRMTGHLLAKTKVKTQIMIVLYISPSRKIPLHMQIYREPIDQPGTLQFPSYPKFEIDFHSFKWGPDTASGVRGFGLVHEMFFNSDICRSASDGSMAKSKGWAEFLLESDPSIAPSFLALSTARRNLAVLSAFARHLNLAVDRVVSFDLNANRPNPGDDKFRIVIRIEMDHRELSLAHLLELGKGKAMGEVRNVGVDGLFQCQILAAQLADEAHFGYRMLDNQCVLPTTLQATSTSVFALSPEGVLDIYSTKMVADSNQDDGQYFGEVVLDEEKVKKLLGLKVLMEIPGREGPLEFSVAQYVTGNHESSTSLTKESKFVASVQIDGVGLIEQDGLIQQVSSGDSLRHCMLACYRDMNCRSYSYCNIGLESQCLVSKLRLDGGVDRIRDRAKATPAGRFEVMIEDQQVNFIKKLTCATYHKHNMDYFQKKTMQNSADITESIVIPVGSSEECANYCVEFSLKKYQNNLDALKTAHESIKQAIRSGAYNSAPEARNILFGSKSIRSELNLICRKFFFLPQPQLSSKFSLIDLAEIKETAENEFNKLKHDEPEVANIFGSAYENYKLEAENIGLCAIPYKHQGAKWNDDIRRRIDESLVDSYHFSAIYLFQETFGISLRDALESGRRRTYLSQLSNGIDLNSDEIKFLIESAARGDNMQHVITAGKAVCAKACHDQLFPCKSFDILIKRDDQDSQDELKFYCQLNSISLGEALKKKRQDLINRETSSANFEHWHYEPIESYDLGTLSESKNDDLLLESLKSHVGSSTAIVAGWLIRIVLIVVGLAMGAYTGIHLAHNYLLPSMGRNCKRTITSPVTDVPTMSMSEFQAAI